MISYLKDIGNFSSQVDFHFRDLSARQGSSNGILQIVANQLGSDEDASYDKSEKAVGSVALPSYACDVSLRKMPLPKGVMGESQTGGVAKVV